MRLAGITLALLLSVACTSKDVGFKGGDALSQQAYKKMLDSEGVDYELDEHGVYYVKRVHFDRAKELLGKANDFSLNVSIIHFDDACSYREFEEELEKLSVFYVGTVGSAEGREIAVSSVDVDGENLLAVASKVKWKCVNRIKANN